MRQLAESNDRLVKTMHSHHASVETTVEKIVSKLHVSEPHGGAKQDKSHWAQQVIQEPVIPALNKSLSSALPPSPKMGSMTAGAVVECRPPPPAADGRQSEKARKSKSSISGVVSGSQPLEIKSIKDAAKEAFKKEKQEKEKERKSKVVAPEPVKTDSAVTRVSMAAQSLIEHQVFDFIAATVIIISSLITGLVVNHATFSDVTPDSYVIFGNLCNVFFTVEVCLRLTAYRQYFFFNADKTWNIFDLILVLAALIDWVMELLQLEKQGVGSGMRIVRMLRIVRVFRVFRFFKELSMLALMIIDSVKSLVWAWFMLMILMYVFAIFFTQGMTDFLKTNEDSAGVSEQTLADIEYFYGDIMKSMYTLFQSMLGGVSWGLPSDALMPSGVAYPLLFFVYIVFAILAVLNIITGVFVDNAMEIAKTERDFLIQKELEMKEKYISEVRDIFSEIDSDGSGSVTWDEFEGYLEDERVQSYFRAMELDTRDVRRLFDMIDDSGDGEVNVDEFLEGCLRLKGLARSIDANAILHECKMANATLMALSDHMSGHSAGKWDKPRHELEPFAANGGTPYV